MFYSAASVVSIKNDVKMKCCNMVLFIIRNVVNLWPTKMSFFTLSIQEQIILKLILCLIPVSVQNTKDAAIQFICVASGIIIQDNTHAIQTKPVKLSTWCQYNIRYTDTLKENKVDSQTVS